jgi:hypothetical protein
MDMLMGMLGAGSGGDKPSDASKHGIQQTPPGQLTSLFQQPATSQPMGGQQSGLSRGEFQSLLDMAQQNSQRRQQQPAGQPMYDPFGF